MSRRKTSTNKPKPIIPTVKNDTAEKGKQTPAEFYQARRDLAASQK